MKIIYVLATWQLKTTNINKDILISLVSCFHIDISTSNIIYPALDFLLFQNNQTEANYSALTS